MNMLSYKTLASYNNPPWFQADPVDIKFAYDSLVKLVASSKNGVMFNDMLGNTLGLNGESYAPVTMTAFGETADKSAMFTGKPYIGELSYAFLFRNYRADQGKWQTSDPVGYPDGWNNLAYVNNGVTSKIDWLGTLSYTIGGITYTFLRWEYVKTYAAIAEHDGNSDGTNITRILWSTEFNIYKPIYSAQCVDSNCKDCGESIGEVSGAPVSGVSYSKSGSKNGPFRVENGPPVTGAPSAMDSLYYAVEKSRDSFPSSIPTGQNLSNHNHKPE